MENEKNELFSHVDTTSQENEFYKMLSEQFSDKKNNLEFITELHEKDIMILIRLWVLHEWAGKKVDLIPMIIQKFISMRVSLRRQGRKELFESFKSQFHVYGTDNGMTPQGGLSTWFRPRR